ncbi:hypothetical protein KI387_022165, partial [Taxus chinensis]
MEPTNNDTALIVTENVSKVGLGYGIAIAVGILVLVSIIMLASYVCVSRVQGIQQAHNTAPILPSLNIVINCIEGGGNLDQSTAIDSFSRRHKLPHSQDTCCSICLAEYKFGENLRLLPDCGHCFHAGCIDAWLRLNPSCPVCRTASPLPSL